MATATDNSTETTYKIPDMIRGRERFEAEDFDEYEAAYSAGGRNAKDCEEAHHHLMIAQDMAFILEGYLNAQDDSAECMQAASLAGEIKKRISKGYGKVDAAHTAHINLFLAYFLDEGRGKAGGDS